MLLPILGVAVLVLVLVLLVMLVAVTMFVLVLMSVVMSMLVTVLVPVCAGLQGGAHMLRKFHRPDCDSELQSSIPLHIPQPALTLQSECS